MRGSRAGAAPGRRDLPAEAPQRAVLAATRPRSGPAAPNAALRERRFGHHGISVAWVGSTARLCELVGRPPSPLSQALPCQFESYTAECMLELRRQAWLRSKLLLLGESLPLPLLSTASHVPRL